MSERNAKGKTPEDYGFRMPNKKGIEKFELHEGASVKKVIGIVSGKGGVGKSFVTSMLASMMQKRNHRVAVLDGDITGHPKASLLELHQRQKDLRVLFIQQSQKMECS